MGCSSNMAPHSGYSSWPTAYLEIVESRSGFNSAVRKLWFYVFFGYNPGWYPDILLQQLPLGSSVTPAGCGPSIMAAWWHYPGYCGLHTPQSFAVLYYRNVHQQFVLFRTLICLSLCCVDCNILSTAVLLVWLFNLHTLLIDGIFIIYAWNLTRQSGQGFGFIVQLLYIPNLLHWYQFVTFSVFSVSTRKRLWVFNYCR